MQTGRWGEAGVGRDTGSHAAGGVEVGGVHRKSDLQNVWKKTFFKRKESNLFEEGKGERARRTGPRGQSVGQVVPLLGVRHPRGWLCPPRGCLGRRARLRQGVCEGLSAPRSWKGAPARQHSPNTPGGPGATATSSPQRAVKERATQTRPRPDGASVCGLFPGFP